MPAGNPPKKFLRNNGVVTLNPEYKVWKQETGGVVQRKTVKAAPISEMSISINILQGEGLVAKDRNFMGKKTSSDPYVEVRLVSGDAGSKHTSVKFLGKTKTVAKNLSPKWDYTVCPCISFLGNANSRLVFTIYDEDKLSSPDCMGIVTIPVVWQDANPSQATWCPVPPKSAKNASGKLQILIKTSVERNQGLRSYV